MNPAGMNRRLFGAVALAVGAVATVGGVFQPLYQEARNFSGRESTLVVTAFGSTGVGAASPDFGVPLVLAALLLLVAAALVFRESPSTPIGRMAAIAGAATLLGSAWSVYLYITNQSAIARASVPPGGTLVQTLDIGLMLLGGGWAVATVGAVVVQDLPDADTGQAEPRERGRETVETVERPREVVRTPERPRETVRTSDRSRETVRTPERAPAPAPAPASEPEPRREPEEATPGGRRRRRHALRERDDEPENDEAIIYQLPDVPVDDVATPPLGFPPAEFGPQEPESLGFPPEEFGPQGPEDYEPTTRVTLDPTDPPGRP
ncbi:MAG: hypothetical protein ABIQ18_50585 [Umezawaea sp.]